MKSKKEEDESTQRCSRQVFGEHLMPSLWIGGCLLYLSTYTYVLL